jgi:hypothetical protein
MTTAVTYFTCLLIIAGVTYKFDNSKHSWMVKHHEDCGEDNVESNENDDKNKEGSIIKQDMSSGTYGYEGDTHTYTDATDGTVYVWDREKNAWFPKVRCQVTVFPKAQILASILVEYDIG